MPPCASEIALDWTSLILPSTVGGMALAIRVSPRSLSASLTRWTAGERSR
jgi:hypothetical protein